MGEAGEGAAASESTGTSVDDFAGAWAAAEAALDGKAEEKAPGDDSGSDAGDEPAEESPKGAAGSKEPKPDDGDGDEGQDDADEQEADPEEEVAESEEQGGKAEELLAELKKLGYDVDPRNLRAVTNPERAKFRAQMRDKRQALAQEVEAANAQLEEQAQKLKTHYSKYEELRQAHERNDFDAVAQALGAKNMKDLNERYFKAIQNPQYQEIIRLREEQEQRKKEEAEQKAEAARQEAARKRDELIAQHKQDLASKLESMPSFGKAFASDPVFVDTVYAIQERNWDPVAQETLSEEEAALEAFESVKVTYQNLKKLLEGAPRRSEPETPAGGESTEEPSAGDAEKPRKRKRSISRHQANEGKAPPPDDMSLSEWAEWASKQVG